MAPRGTKPVHTGKYQRYDGMTVEVLYLTQDADTGTQTLVCRDAQSVVYTITRQSFLARTEWKGRFVTKYTPLEEQEPPAYRRPRCTADYHAYAKDLCENFAADYRQYKLCVDQKQYLIPKEDLAAIKEDMNFLNNCLKTVLSPYNDLFKGRFAEEMSIRKYAEVAGKNRGSVEYEQKKLFAALAEALRARDETEGKNRMARESV